MKIFKTSLAVISILFLLGLSLTAQTAVDADETEMDFNDYLGRPQNEIQDLMTENQTKGQELYDAGQYKESITWINRGIFFSEVLIKQAELRKQALNRIEEARKEVERAKSRL